MKSKIVVGFLALMMALSLMVTSGPRVEAINLGGILKGAAVALLVDRFDKQIDSAVNTLTANRDLGHDQATRVVPILSLGSGGYIGAAQVIGTQEQVDKVRAVAQLEGNFMGRDFRIKALVPVGSRTTSNIKRIYGVGVSAVIDVKI